MAEKVIFDGNTNNSDEVQAKVTSAWGGLTRTHMKMALLRSRWLKQMELSTSLVEENEVEVPTSDQQSSRGSLRWSRIRQAVVSTANAVAKSRRDDDDDDDYRQAERVDGGDSGESKFATIEEEDASLIKYWRSLEVHSVVPPPASSSSSSFSSSSRALGSLPATSVPDFEHEFCVSAEQVSVSVSKVPTFVLQQEQSRVESRLFEQRERALSAIQSRESDLVWREHLARQRVESVEEAARRNIAVEREKAEAEFVRREKGLGRDYRRTREQLEAEVKRRNCALMEEFGHVSIGTENISRLMQLRSSSLPQPVEFRVHLLRAVKEKLPKGAYVLMLSQYESLGGQPLCWSKLAINGIGPCFPSVTVAARHQGRFFDKMLKFEDSIFALCPPQQSLKPGFCFVLELFQVSTRTNKLDKCVAWTALPLCTEHFTVPQGMYKLPFLKGAHSPLVQNYKEMERAMASDINNWLCNGYIEIRSFPLQQVLKQLQSSAADVFRSTNLRVQFDYLNKRIRPVCPPPQQAGPQNQPSSSSSSDDAVEWGVKSGLFMRKKPSPVSSSPTFNNVSKGKLVFDSMHGSNSSMLSIFSGKSKKDPSEHHHRSGDYTVDSPPLLPPNHGDVHVFSAEGDLDNSRKDESVSGDQEFAGNEIDDDDAVVFERGYREEDELFLHPEQRGKLAGVETVDGVEDRRWATSGLEGEVVRRWQSDGTRLDSEATEEPSVLPRSGGGGGGDNRPWEVLDNPRTMELFTYSIASNPSQRKRLLPGAIASFKLRFLSLEALGDLMPHLWGSLDSYITIFVMLIALWLRIYLHYLGEYVYLAGYGAPIFAFELQPLQISFKYMSSSIPQAVEIGLVAIGPITNNMFFVAFSLVGMLIFGLAGFVPEGYNKFVSCFGLVTLLDPLLILIVDLGYQNFNCAAHSELCLTNYTSPACQCFVGDFVKLWDRTTSDEGSGISGLLITLIIYLGNSIVSSFVLVEYLTHIHRNARILDIWRRISGPPEEFFVPEDFEVSHEELTGICKRAESWRGPSGSRRRVVVHNYTETDKVDATFAKTTSHIAIYELAVDNVPLKLHRQFLRYADGSIVETFGPISMGNSDAGGSQAAAGDAVAKGPDTKLFHVQQQKLFSGLENF